MAITGPHRYRHLSDGLAARNAITWLAAVRAVATQAGMPTPSYAAPQMASPR
jgi:hypothetical protein